MIDSGIGIRGKATITLLSLILAFAIVRGCSVFVEVGVMSHPCEDELVVKCTHRKVPYFNAPIYLENKQQIGKIDEILGPITDFVSFT